MNSLGKILVMGAAAALALQITLDYWAAKAATPKRTIPHGIDKDVFLAAIAEKETGNDPRAIGHLGERSRYQLTADTWAMHSDVAFAQASVDGVLADIVASLHFDWLELRLRAQQIPVTVRTMAAAWNYGQRWAWVCRESAYAQDVENLYLDEVRK